MVDNIEGRVRKIERECFDYASNKRGIDGIMAPPYEITALMSAVINQCLDAGGVKNYQHEIIERSGHGLPENTRKETGFKR